MTTTMTTHVEAVTSFLVGHDTFFISMRNSFKNCFILSKIVGTDTPPPRSKSMLITDHRAHRIHDGHPCGWQARRDSNPQHPDLESGALSVRATGLH